MTKLKTNKESSLIYLWIWFTRTLEICKKIVPSIDNVHNVIVPVNENQMDADAGARPIFIPVLELVFTNSRIRST